MTYTITELAAANGLTLRALRFYEQKGMLKPKRTGGNDRIYSENDALRLAQIIRGARFGLTLKEIARYLEDTATGPWLFVPAEIAARQVAVLEGEIALKRSVLATLRELAEKPASDTAAAAGSGRQSGPGKRARSGPRKAAR